MENELLRAIQLHQSGQLEEAGRLYQDILTRRPDNPDALHLFGVLLYQLGQAERAVALIERAVALQPRVAAYYSNLGEVYRALGQNDRAIAACRTAMRLQPEYPEAINNLGLALLARGDNEEALAQFQTAVRLKPDFAMAYNNLGNVIRIQGDHDRAIDLFREALRHDPRLAEAHSNLGQLLFENKQPREALTHCEESVRLRPRFPEGLSNLGNVLREIGRLEEAKTCYATALRINPRLGMVHNNIGQALQEEGKLDDAIVWYQRALALEPDTARIHCNLASALQEQENYDEAIARFEIALHLDPNSSEAHNGLGFVRHEQGDYDEARRRFETALRLHPDFAPAYCNLGTLKEELNDMEGALACFRDALRQDPRLPGPHAQLATILRGKLPEEDLNALKQLLADPDLIEARRAPLHFGLAHVLDARGEYAAAGEHLREANRLSVNLARKRNQTYDPVSHNQFVTEMIATCSRDWFARLQGLGDESERPIFIFGLPRSGTTLVEQVLASHSQVFGAGELRFARDDFESLSAVMKRGDSVFRCLAEIDADTMGQVARRHLERLTALDADVARVADKMPDNYLYLGILAILFPQAKFIHCRRDLRDIAVSCWITNFRHIRWACDPDHIASRFAEYRRLMAYWTDVLPVPVLEIDYEDTVGDFENVARRLVAWCGLEWEEGCLAFHETKRPVRTASVTQVRQPLYTRSVARWKHYQDALGSLFDRLV
jgi:tetratricopeptide (TPR) repeat protein